MCVCQVFYLHLCVFKFKIYGILFNKGRCLRLPKNRLRKLRQEKGLTLKELSHQLKEKGTPLSTSSLIKYERGERKPKLETWLKLADFFGVSVPYLQGSLNNDFSDKELKKLLNSISTLNENLSLKDKIPEDQEKLLYEINIYWKYLVNIGKRDDIPKGLNGEFIKEYLKSLWALTFSMLCNVETGLQLADYVNEHVFYLSDVELNKVSPDELIELPSDLIISSSKFFRKSEKAKKKLKLAKKIVKENQTDDELPF